MQVICYVSPGSSASYTSAKHNGLGMSGLKQLLQLMHDMKVMQGTKFNQDMFVVQVMQFIQIIMSKVIRRSNNL